MSLFLSHGAPDFVLRKTPAHSFLQDLGANLERPKSIIMISAHYESQNSTVRINSNPAPHTIHDFFGFPEALYELNYPAPGNPELAKQIASVLSKNNFQVRQEPTHGIDHGVWMPLQLMYPAADIPVVALSVSPQQSPRWHWQLGQTLGELPDVVVVGSGSLTHNLRALGQSPESGYRAFAQWMFERLSECDLNSLLAYREKAPFAAKSHPTDEHLLPLFTALGAAGKPWHSKRLHHSFDLNNLSMDSYQFTDIRPQYPAG